MKSKELSFIGHNLAKFNPLEFSTNSTILVYNLSFYAIKNQVTGFLFEDRAPTKRALINILKGKDQTYSGFFEYDNQIYFPKSRTTLQSIVALADLENFKTRKMSVSRTFGFLKTHKIYDQKYDLGTWKRFHANPHIDKNQLLLDAKKLDFDYNKKINNEMTKMVAATDDYLRRFKALVKRLRHPDDQQLALTLMTDFSTRYETYLSKRVELLYFKNNRLIQYLVTKSTQKGDPNALNLSGKMQSLYQEIRASSMPKKSTNSPLVSRSDWEKSKSELQETRNKNWMILKIKQNDFRFFMRKHKFEYQQSADVVTASKHLYHYLVNRFFIDFIKKNLTRVLYLNDAQMDAFINEMNGQNNLLLFEVNTFIKSAKNLNSKKATNQWITSIFKLDMAHFATLSSSNYKMATEPPAPVSLASEPAPEAKADFDWNNNLAWKKVQYQNLRDEYNWLKSNNVLALNKKLVELNLEAQTISNCHQELKQLLNQKLTALAAVRHQVLTKLEAEALRRQWRMIEESFKSINQEYLQIFRALKEDAVALEVFLKRYFRRLRPRDAQTFLTKYKTTSLMHLCGLQLTPATEAALGHSNLELAKLFLVEALLDDKPIVVFNNLFRYLNSDEHELFLVLFKRIQKLFARIWIHFANSYQEIAAIATTVNIIKDGLNIECGKVEALKPQPFYALTAALLHYLPATTVPTTPAPVLEFSQRNKSYLYDHYNLGNGHCIYGSVEEIYQLRQQLPQSCHWTLNPLKIEEFKNRLAQQHSDQLEPTTSSVLEQVSDQEELIIDVRSQSPAA